VFEITSARNYALRKQRNLIQNFQDSDEITRNYVGGNYECLKGFRGILVFKGVNKGNQELVGVISGVSDHFETVYTVYYSFRQIINEQE
jgi:hypothetical protein